MKEKSSFLTEICLFRAEIVEFCSKTRQKLKPRKITQKPPKNAPKTRKINQFLPKMAQICSFFDFCLYN